MYAYLLDIFCFAVVVSKYKNRFLKKESPENKPLLPKNYQKKPVLLFMGSDLFILSTFCLNILLNILYPHVQVKIKMQQHFFHWD